MPPMKAVLQLSIHEERIRKKALVTVSRISGVTSITIDDKTGKMTVIGEVDVAVVVMKLRKLCKAEIVSAEVVKPPEKKPEPAKPAPPKPDPTKPVEIVAWPGPMNYQYQYTPAYANTYYHGPYKAVAADEPSCVIM